MSQFFNILLHHRLLPRLRALPTELGAAVQKCCERLQFGYWDNGTRVKLLRGVRKLVYEARINRGWRLLFTAARLPAAHPPYALEPCLLLWDVLDHDAVEVRARRLNVQPETGFLDFIELASAELTEAPSCPEVDVTPTAETAAAPQAAAWLTGLLNATAATTPPHEDMGESIRWFELAAEAVTDPAQWQALLDAPDSSDLELKLSEEQARTIFAPGPVLLRGTAGSGKTTVSVYRLAHICAANPSARVLYVTYSDALLDTVRRLFGDLLRARRLASPILPPQFMTFPELYCALNRASGTTARDVLRFPAFEQWYRSLYRLDDAALAWEEIRGILKGACRDLARDHLSEQAYEELGRKRAPLFVQERPRLFKVFLKYREWCRQDGRSDDLDLARAAARILAAAGAAQPTFDHVLCDEGQDLTELEMALLFTLCRDAGGLFFTADPQQIVNPSGFRWAEIRSLLRERGPGQTAPGILGLTRNYRSVASIVALANALIRVQRDRTGRSDDDEFQDTQLQGAMPVLAQGAEDDIMSYVRGFGPRCAVITMTAAEAERLGARLGTERVFSVAGAKGLEFDACVLWNPLGGELGMWRTILAEPQVSLKEHPGARRVLHHLYVGVTRARRYLGIYEEQAAAAALWQSGPLRAQVEADAPEALAKFMVFAASPAEWDKEGVYFLERRRFKQAAECFRRAGNDRREQESLARFHESVEDFARAVEAYMAAGLGERAAVCLERLGRFSEAARAFAAVGAWPAAGLAYERAREFDAAAHAFREAGDGPGETRCRMHQAVLHHDWDGAAHLALKLGDRVAAADYFARAGKRKEADQLRLEVALATGDHLGAGRILEQQADFDRAAAEYRFAGDPGHAQALTCEARGAEARGDLAIAEARWTELGDTRRADDCIRRRLEAASDWTGLAAFHERRNNTADAIKALSRLPEDDPTHPWLMALIKYQERCYGDAAEAFEDLGRFEQARRAAEECIRFHPAARKASRVRSMSDDDWGAYNDELRQRRISNSVLLRHRMRAARRAGTPRVALRLPGQRMDTKTQELHRDIAIEVGDWKRAAKDSEHLKDWEAAIQYHERARDAKGLMRAQAIMAEERRDFRTAGDLWTRLGKKTFAARNYGRAAEETGDLAAAVDFYQQARLPAVAYRVRERIAAGAKAHPAPAPEPEPAPAPEPGPGPAAEATGAAASGLEPEPTPAPRRRAGTTSLALLRAAVAARLKKASPATGSPASAPSAPSAPPSSAAAVAPEPAPPVAAPRRRSPVGTPKTPPPSRTPKKPSPPRSPKQPDLPF